MAERDLELVTRYKSGDQAAFETLYRRYVEKVWRYGWLRTRSRESASDIAQETFLRVAKNVGRFEGRSEFATWLFAVARSVTVDHLRRERTRRPDPELLRVIPLIEEREDVVEAEERKEAVRAAVSKLCAAQRDVLVLCQFSGMSMKEAGETLGWKETRVKVTLFRARRRVREMLRGYMGSSACDVAK